MSFRKPRVSESLELRSRECGLWQLDQDCAGTSFDARALDNSVHDVLPGHLAFDSTLVRIQSALVGAWKNREALKLRGWISSSVEQRRGHFAGPELCLATVLDLGYTQNALKLVSEKRGGSAGGEGHMVFAQRLHGPRVALLADWASSPEGSTPYPAGELAFELVSLFLVGALGPRVKGRLGFSSNDVLSRNPATPDENLVFLRKANLIGVSRVALAMGSHLGQIIRAAECEETWDPSLMRVGKFRCRYRST
ncbi:hypothetical protein HG530_009941 [Fusarium avenaceum]|nr:hypothetical protein HG530_009941 [Fusarium avenaceum]